MLVGNRRFGTYRSVYGNFMYNGHHCIMQWCPLCANLNEGDDGFEVVF